MSVRIQSEKNPKEVALFYKRNFSFCSRVSFLMTKRAQNAYPTETEMRQFDPNAEASIELIIKIG